MTDHQIAYNRLLEERRANRAKERETNRSNLANEAIKYAELEEKGRAARAQEAENQRHNLIYEAESNRHNMASEMNQVYGVDVQAGLGYANVDVSKSNVGLGYAQLGELKRANLVNEELKTISTEAERQYKEAQIATRGKELEIAKYEKDIKRLQYELQASEHDLNVDRFEYEKQLKDKQLELEDLKVTYQNDKNIMDSITNILRIFMPTLSFSSGTPNPYSATGGF